MFVLRNIIISGVMLAWSGAAMAASYTYMGGGLRGDNVRQGSSGTGLLFAPERSFDVKQGHLRLLQQNYLGKDPLVLEMQLDGGAYGRDQAFYDSSNSLSWDYEGATSLWHFGLSSRFGFDDFGLLRRPLKEQFEGRFYSDRGKRSYQYISLEVFQRQEMRGDWFSEFYLLGQYLYRDLSSRDALLQLRLGYRFTPTWAVGVGSKGFSQWWERAFSSSVGVYAFTEYEYFPEAKFALLVGTGEARAQGTKQPSQLYGVNLLQPLLRGELQGSYERSQSAAAAGTGVNEEEVFKLLWKYQLTQQQFFDLNGLSSRETQHTAALVEKRQRELAGLTYAYRWGRGLRIKKDMFENEAALRYETERWRQRGSGDAWRQSISCSWSFLR